MLLDEASIPISEEVRGAVDPCLTKRTQRFELKVDILTRNNGEKFAFVGNVIFRAIHERRGAIVLDRSALLGAISLSQRSVRVDLLNKPLSQSRSPAREIRRPAWPVRRWV